MMQPLAAAGASPSQANTNLSTSISLSILTQTGHNIPIRGSNDNPIEFIIPRDINLHLPPMTIENVTSINNTDNQLYNLHLVDIIQSNHNLIISLHFEMNPINTRLGYIFIYRFDDAAHLSSSINQID
ncbi:unnamed protein product, partial [Rotaria sp. Silwood2]